MQGNEEQSSMNCTNSSSLLSASICSKISVQATEGFKTFLECVTRRSLLSLRRGHLGRSRWERVSSSRLQSSQIPELVGEKCLSNEPTLYIPLNIHSCMIIGGYGK